MIYLVTYYDDYENPDGDYLIGHLTRYFTDKAEAETYMNKMNDSFGYECYRVVEILKG